MTEMSTNTEIEAEVLDFDCEPLDLTLNSKFNSWCI